MSIHRRRIAGLLAAAVGATVLAGLPSAATADSSPNAAGVRPAATASPNAYVDWLKAKADAGDGDAVEYSKQYQALPAEKQKKYLEYINDRSYFDVFANAVEGKGAARTVMAGGDVVVSRGGDSGPEAAQQGGGESGPEAAGSRDMWASHWVKVKYFGLEATRVTVKTSYRVKGKNTTKVHPGTAWHKNYIAGTELTRTPVDEWISAEPADNAHSETVWTFEWWTGIEDTGRHRVWADYSGFKGGYLKT
ncbi:hypothetical protein [Streptomyces albireticuli]|uniref:hypothetical protein n=1 Tax=Streptomyces albireticuli TaxID=1940 RepID=UPI00117F9D7E|nr:hypothetical protein [Streptomyces albireticuli]MCD9145718.1 hypothetical protein [Streptomyces albireticuli]MCD9165550.1 hypothetical protein [Streptomyces albireticuli]MCD9195927.1 hypothetical protein [Streptomyces albireticuli]